MMKIVETMWSRIPQDALTNLVPKIEPSRLQEVLINPAISQLQIIYKECFSTNQVQLESIQLSQGLIHELKIKQLSETFSTCTREYEVDWNLVQQLKTDIITLQRTIDAKNKNRSISRKPTETKSKLVLWQFMSNKWWNWRKNSQRKSLT